MSSALQPATPFAPTASANTLRLELPTFPEAWSRAVRPSWPFVAIAALALAAGCSFGPFVYGRWDETLLRVATVAVFIMASAVFAANGRPRTALVLEGFALTMAVAVTVPGLTSMIAALCVPYHDADLVAVDRAMGFDWKAIVLTVRSHPGLSVFLSYCYSSLLWQPILVLVLLGYADPERLRRILAASTVTLCFTIAIFVLVPAKTGYVYFGFERADFPHLYANTGWGAYEILEAIRGGDRQLSLEGLVTFPSYHAVAAVLFAYGWAAVPVLRWPFVPLNIAMFVATVPIGSHYVVDVLVAIPLAAAAVYGADRYFCSTDRQPPLERWDETEPGRLIKDRANAFVRVTLARLP